MTRGAGDRIAALTWLCRVVSPLTLAPPSPPVELWSEVVGLADAHLLLPELKLGLDRFGLTAPGEIAEVLNGVYELNRHRNTLLRRQMRDISHALADAGLAPIWLKGAAELLEPGWAGIGRMMNDLDVWLPDAADQSKALACLASLGYSVMAGFQDDEWEDSHHYAPWVNDAWPARIETHRYVVDSRFAALLPDDGALAAVDWMEWRGCRVGRLGPEHRALHALVQATVMAVPPLASGRTPLMKGLDVARRVGADFGGRFPTELMETLRLPQWDGQAAPFLTMAERLFGLPNPLPADESAWRRLCAVTASPRRDYLRGLRSGNLLGRIMKKITQPATIMPAVRRLLRVFVGGQDDAR